MSVLHSQHGRIDEVRVQVCAFVVVDLRHVRQYMNGSGRGGGREEDVVVVVNSRRAVRAQPASLSPESRLQRHNTSEPTKKKNPSAISQTSPSFHSPLPSSPPLYKTKRKPPTTKTANAKKKKKEEKEKEKKRKEKKPP